VKLNVEYESHVTDHDTRKIATHGTSPETYENDPLAFLFE